ncbi:N-acetylglucosaminyl phosphatidylinositol deacetylase [Cordyceps militaris CM01]|uniref:N-acetylglucosaminylphosphatidylinositol deacetylase n=1 Tax=Cordyceps militaris (strain CM01) TaxID=983644 RepID=G3JPI8_CORMM|nr:N-acetylglucosaminyl phosphatidylinositol deacetylase [Cordyceps militaris CM01]EGX89798.1 N-acetylglucosaminyl phosphatidylinositol deacetylase [Cordyceps militaris CM01]
MGPIFILIASVAVLVPMLYMYTVGIVHARFPKLHNKRICLLIAHPDDEAMFFAPTVLALTRPETGNHVKILCLSSGNAEGLGETRKKELVKSGMTLGLRDEEDVFVVDNPADFPDSMTATWDESKIAGLLMSAFAPNLHKQKAADQQPAANIDVLITFDAGGVSAHPNHSSLFHGARRFIAALLRGPGGAGWAAPVDLYTLRSVHVARKFTSVLDVLPTLAAWAATSARNPDKAHPPALVFLSGLVGDGALPTAWSAMTSAHKSQMVWFRWLYITFSRYMLINDLQLEKVKA